MSPTYPAVLMSHSAAEHPWATGSSWCSRAVHILSPAAGVCGLYVVLGGRGMQTCNFWQGTVATALICLLDIAWLLVYVVS